jgi:hypothetical protein
MDAKEANPPMKRLIQTSLAAMIVVAALPFAAHAEEHPAYLHALSDLRSARWLIKHRAAGWKAAMEEDEAWRDIERAIGEIKHAAIDDGKDIEDHPAAQDQGDHGGRLHRALDLLRKTRDDLKQAEENGHARGLRRRALKHVDNAIRHVEHAIHDGEKHHYW